MHHDVKVSAAVLCYNQSRFIGEAIESALAQQTTFSYEIVVADDWSTDGTSEIVDGYRRSHPDRIRVLPRSRHLGMNENYMGLYAACRGEYVAFLEGDDFWTSPHKLQKQADVLDSRANVAICYHRAHVLVDRSAAPPALHPGDDSPPVETVEDLLRGDCIVTCATMLRRQFDSLPDWFAELPTLDWPAFVLHALSGRIAYLPEVMSSYRLHPGGVWSSLSRREKLPKKIEVRRRVADELGEPYQSILAPVIHRLARELSELQAAS